MDLNFYNTDINYGFEILKLIITVLLTLIAVYYGGHLNKGSMMNQRRIECIKNIERVMFGLNRYIKLHIQYELNKSMNELVLNHRLKNCFKQDYDFEDSKYCMRKVYDLLSEFTEYEIEYFKSGGKHNSDIDDFFESIKYPISLLVVIDLELLKKIPTGDDFYKYYKELEIEQNQSFKKVYEYSFERLKKLLK